MSEPYSPQQLLPHRGEMLLIDRVVSISENGASGETAITPERLFVEPEKGFPWWASIELMAQTVGLWIGEQQLKNNEAIKLGFLLGSRNFKGTGQYFSLHSTVNIKAKAIMVEKGGVSVFDCTVEGIDSEGATVKTSARLKAIQPENVVELTTQIMASKPTTINKH